MLCCVKIKCKITNIDKYNNTITIKSNKLFYLNYLENYIEDNYFDNTYSKITSINDNKIHICDFKNKIYSIPGFDAFGSDCLTKLNRYNIFAYIFVNINKDREWKLIYILNGRNIMNLWEYQMYAKILHIMIWIHLKFLVHVGILRIIKR